MVKLRLETKCFHSLVLPRHPTSLFIILFHENLSILYYRLVIVQVGDEENPYMLIFSKCERLCVTATLHECRGFFWDEMYVLKSAYNCRILGIETNVNYVITLNTCLLFKVRLEDIYFMHNLKLRLCLRFQNYLIFYFIVWFLII